MEFCACHQEGIYILFQQIETVFEGLKSFLQPYSDVRSILYPAATVLLDMTANENCIEKVAELMLQNDMFEFVLSQLKELLRFKPESQLHSKLRDLLIGVVLNLACNVESDEITSFLIKNGVVSLLKV